MWADGYGLREEIKFTEKARPLDYKKVGQSHQESR